jgi:MGT family glycosyltransferase
VLAIGHNNDARAYADAPENVLVRNFAPQLALLDRVDAVISHGGNNTVTEALLHGLPLVVIPNSADQPESAGRIKASGSGIRMRPRQAKPEILRRAIEAVLYEPSFRQAAQRIQASFMLCNGPLTSARLVSRFAEVKKPLHRPAGMGPTVRPEDISRLATGE